ncbi:TMTC3 (predicted) [Pycnogonum litorale]
MLKEAEETLVKGKLLLSWKKRRIPINHFKIFITLANVISQNVSRLEEANQLYIEVAELRPDYVEAYINRGDILIKLNRTNEAKEVYRSALKYNTNCADLYYNLAVISAQENDVLQALDYLSEALEDDPDHEPSLLNSALLVQEHQVSEETLTAYHRLLRLLQSGDRYDEKVYFNLGMLSLTAGSSWNAEYWLRKAIQVKEDFKSALFNLALLLADESRPLEAVTFINQLLKFHPNHTKALILMGDIYVNNMKDLESAEQVYQRILEIDPHEIQGLHNLCVIHYKRQELVKAEKCLLEVAKIAPHKDYIKRHLKMVRNELESISTGDVLKDQISAFGYSSR